MNSSKSNWLMVWLKIGVLVVVYTLFVFMATRAYVKDTTPKVEQKVEKTTTRKVELTEISLPKGTSITNLVLRQQQEIERLKKKNIDLTTKFHKILERKAGIDESKDIEEEEENETESK